MNKTKKKKKNQADHRKNKLSAEYVQFDLCIVTRIKREVLDVQKLLHPFLLGRI